MIPQPPSGQGPLDPRGAFSPPPPPPGGFAVQPPPNMPPPGMFPPMMPMPYPPPRPRHSFTRGILVTLATTIFSISLLLNLFYFGFGSSSDMGPVVEEPVKTGGKDKIAVIPVRGTIDDQMAMLVEAFIHKVEDDKDVKAVVIEMDSPGGGVGASDLLYHRMQSLKTKRNLKMVVSMSDLGASGGYYISCAADHIVAQPTTLTGSIGVLFMNFNATELAKKIGIADETQTAPQGGYKNVGWPLRPTTQRDKDYMQALINETFDQFTGVVRTARKGKLKGIESDIFNGKVFTAAQAQKNGLIDQIGYLDDACDWVAKSAGITNPTIVRYHRRPSMFERLLASSNAKPQASGGVNVNVSLDAKAFDELTTPRMQYLWKGQ